MDTVPAMREDTHARGETDRLIPAFTRRRATSQPGSSRSSGLAGSDKEGTKKRSMLRRYAQVVGVRLFLLGGVCMLGVGTTSPVVDLDHLFVGALLVYAGFGNWEEKFIRTMVGGQAHSTCWRDYSPSWCPPCSGCSPTDRTVSFSTTWYTWCWGSRTLRPPSEFGRPREAPPILHGIHSGPAAAGLARSKRSCTPREPTERWHGASSPWPC